MRLIMAFIGEVGFGMVSRTAGQNEAAVAIAAVSIAYCRINLQPNARMAERSASNVAGSHAGNSRGVCTRCFGRLCHRQRD